MAQRVNFVNKEFGKTFSVKELKELKELNNNADSAISSLKVQQSRLNQMDKGNSKSDIPLNQEKEKIDFALDKYTQVQDLSERSSGGLFDGIVQGIEQAQQYMEQQYKQQTNNTKQKRKYKQKG